MSRQADIQPFGMLSVSPSLPPVDWSLIGQRAPTRIPVEGWHPEYPLPAADIVILTWTSAEWAALDHVFLNSTANRSMDALELQQDWKLYSRGAASVHADKLSGPLWGYFQLIRITDRSGRPWRVLLFKSDAHLAHLPWIDGLSAMLRCILQDAKPDRIYSIGTAGGSRLHERLGDAVITNAALLNLQQPDNVVDDDNGAIFRCRTWFPATALLEEVERCLCYPLNQTVTREKLASLFGELQAKYPNDPGIKDLTLDDLINDPIRPDNLGAPRIRSMQDVPLLTTDYYFVADGQDADAYSFLEMDDAVIAREAEKAGVRYAFIRNISDPIVPSHTSQGKPISPAVRGDWSSMIYTNFGLLTSYNGALAAWATIAGEGAAVYNPERFRQAPAETDPLEVKLVRQVGTCGSCSFFWPKEKRQQPYGPYTSFDFDLNAPYAPAEPPAPAPRRWVFGRTRPPAFPSPEVIDGCRKAPIMTIGINPNLTAFLPGQTGAALCYPDFSSDQHTDAWAKYAWYYRYRSVYQEQLSLDFVRRFILPEGRIFAERSGLVTGTNRPNASPTWSITVRYDGDASDTTITLPGQAGDFPNILLFNLFEPNNRFQAGDMIAGRLAVPAGIKVEIDQQPQSYYMQFFPALQQFQEVLRQAGHAQATLRIGEDVSQLDMVACASPHWNPDYLGGSEESLQEIVNNCIHANAWAVKQIVQSRPAVLYIVSKASWDMFYTAMGACVRRDPPLSTNPADNDYTLLRETTDPNHPCYLDFDITIDGQRYQSTTRLVITPHFSYNSNFLPQYRLSPADWRQFGETYKACKDALVPANGFQVAQPDQQKYPGDFISIQLPNDAQKACAAQEFLQQKFPDAYNALQLYYYDPHTMMASVLKDLYAHGTLIWQDATTAAAHGYLARTAGSCQFCVNAHWYLPPGCPYKKDKEQAPQPGFLERVAEKIMGQG